MRLVAENEEKHQLEQTLFNTIHSLITADHENFQDYDYDDSNCLTMQDFTDFVLVPFVACSLIAEDIPDFTLQDSIFERNNSTEYGDAVHEVHRQNLQAIRSLERNREFPLYPALPQIKSSNTAPPRHRKKEAAFKIRVPVRKPPVEPSMNSGLRSVKGRRGRRRVRLQRRGRIR
ncbi:hypothetical protein B0H14DRAFT_2601533 [Mycena olivaceomarginata]|nr:hypothetical protein B0H14DRAFT_2601533 [Mycena olivaceomarginata]